VTPERRDALVGLVNVHTCKSRRSPRSGWGVNDRSAGRKGFIISGYELQSIEAPSGQRVLSVLLKDGAGDDAAHGAEPSQQRCSKCARPRSTK
jgi:hypothetical protein